MKKGNFKALLPIGVFLVLYLGLGILFEYVLRIPMGFYNIPIVVAFLAALLVDGQVKGKWKEQPKRVEITLFAPLNKSQLQAVRRECRRLWPEKQLLMAE